MFAGGDAYAVRNVRGWTYLYPPLFALLMGPLTGLQTHDAAYIWFLASLLLAAGCVVECRRVARLAWSGRTGGDAVGFVSSSIGASRAVGGAGSTPSRLPVVLGLLAFGAALLPGLNCLQRGQVGFAVLYPLLLGLRLVCEGVDQLGAGREEGAERLTGRRAFWGGFWMALPVAIKVTPALVPAAAGWWLALRSRGRRSAMELNGGSTQVGLNRGRSPAAPLISWLAGIAVGATSFFLLIPATLIGWNANVRQLGRWFTEVARSDDLGLREGIVRHSARNQSFENAVFHFANACGRVAGARESAFEEAKRISATVPFPVSPDRVRVASRVASIVFIGMLIACVSRVRAGRSAADLAVVAGLAGVVSLAVSPISWGHHFVLLLPGVMFVALRIAEQGFRRALWMGIIPLALVLLHYAWLEIAGYVGLLGLGTTAWCIAAMLMLARPGKVVAAGVSTPSEFSR